MGNDRNGPAFSIEYFAFRGWLETLRRGRSNPEGAAMIQDEELIPDSHERTESTLVKIPLYRTGLPVKASQAGFFLSLIHI